MLPSSLWPNNVYKEEEFETFVVDLVDSFEQPALTLRLQIKVKVGKDKGILFTMNAS